MTAVMIEFSKLETHDRLVATQWLPRPVSEVFPFFADAANLEQLTPPWLKFEIRTPQPVQMKVGALIDYRLKLYGLPIGWRTEITAWEPNQRFVDEQIKGPYKLWRHEHRFEPKDGGTLVTDTVDFVAPLRVLSTPLFVKPDVKRIFDFRFRELARRFAQT